MTASIDYHVVDHIEPRRIFERHDAQVGRHRGRPVLAVPRPIISMTTAIPRTIAPMNAEDEDMSDHSRHLPAALNSEGRTYTDRHRSSPRKNIRSAPDSCHGAVLRGISPVLIYGPNPRPGGIRLVTKGANFTPGDRHPLASSLRVRYANHGGAWGRGGRTGPDRSAERRR